MTEIKQCPFKQCGSKDIVLEDDSKKSRKCKMFHHLFFVYVRCQSCGATGPKLYTGNLKEAQKKAIKAWNEIIREEDRV